MSKIMRNEKIDEISQRLILQSLHNLFHLAYIVCITIKEITPYWNNDVI